MTGSGQAPYGRLSAFYLLYFGAIGILVPFWGLYLRHRGFDAAAIGGMFAVLMAMRIFMPTLWAWLADLGGGRRVGMRLAAALAPLSFSFALMEPGVHGMVLVLAAFGTAWAGLLPQFEANTLDHLGRESNRYGHVRLWGSVGFILAVLLGGRWLAGAGVAHVPVVLLTLLAATFVAALVTPVAGTDRVDLRGEGLLPRLRQPAVLGLLAACVLCQASFGTFYAFFSIYVRDAGYSPQLTGLLWAWGVAAEILVFLYTPRLLARVPTQWLMILALGSLVVRWLLTGLFPGSLLLLFLAQTLHMTGFGLFHAVAIFLVHRLFPGRTRNRGQALYSSIGFGLGGAAGSAAAGYTWQHGGATSAWLLSALFAALALAVIIITGAARAPRDISA